MVERNPPSSLLQVIGLTLMRAGNPGSYFFHYQGQNFVTHLLEDGTDLSDCCYTDVIGR